MVTIRCSIQQKLMKPLFWSQLFHKLHENFPVSVNTVSFFHHSSKISSFFSVFSTQIKMRIVSSLQIPLDTVHLLIPTKLLKQWIFLLLWYVKNFITRNIQTWISWFLSIFNAIEDDTWVLKDNALIHLPKCDYNYGYYVRCKISVILVSVIVFILSVVPTSNHICHHKVAPFCHMTGFLWPFLA